MNRHTQKIFVIAFSGMFIVTSAFVSQVKAAEDFGLGLFNTPELFEQNAFQPAFDIWVNQSVSASPSQLKYSLEEITQGWALRRYLLAPPIDSEKDVFTNLAEGITVLRRNNLLTVQGYVDYNAPGYDTFSTSTTDTVANCDQMDIGTKDVGMTVDLNDDYLEADTYPTQPNYTRIDSDTLLAAVRYEAGDGKTINDYGKDSAESQNREFYNVHNATLLGFGYDDHDGLINVATCFDEELLVSTFVKGQMTFQSSTLVRHRVWVHQKEVDQGWSGWTSTTKHTSFRPISQASGQLAGIPQGAQHFFNENISSVYWGETISTMPKAFLEDGTKVDLDAINPDEDSYTIKATKIGMLRVMSTMYRFKTVIIGFLILTPIILIGLVLVVLWRKGKLKNPFKKGR